MCFEKGKLIATRYSYNCKLKNVNKKNSYYYYYYYSESSNNTVLAHFMKFLWLTKSFLTFISTGNNKSQIFIMRKWLICLCGNNFMNSDYIVKLTVVMIG